MKIITSMTKVSILAKTSVIIVGLLITFGINKFYVNFISTIIG